MIDRLLSEKVQKLIEKHLDDDPKSLRLKWSKKPNLPVREIIDQIVSHKKALTKIPSLVKKGIIYPPPLSVEQCSSEYLAEYKSALFSGDRFVDLTGGFGIDTLFFSRNFKESVYVEVDPWLCKVVAHNFDLWGAEIKVLNSTAEKFLSDAGRKADLIYLDPTRRKGGERVFFFQDTHPNVLKLVKPLLEMSDKILIKASPLIDLKKAIDELIFVQRIWILALKNEVKEVLFLIGRRKNPNPEITVHNLFDHDSFQFNRGEEDIANSSYGVPQVGDYIYDPNKALMKSGAFKLIGDRYNLKKLGLSTHLYFSSRKIPFPGRVFKIQTIISGKKKKQLVGKFLEIISKNYSLEAYEIQKKYKINPGVGKNFLIAAGRRKEALLMECSKLESRY